MRYELTIKMQLDSDRSQDRVEKLFESLFGFGTIKESIVDGLQLLDDPRLVAVAVTRTGSGEGGNPSRAYRF